ncbi:hypothetical protein CGQ24_07450 [Arthrobacter sp. 7749]|nr:hypothetical protein CGQ24_07450 [Arthrobacter sp. 7749]
MGTRKKSVPVQPDQPADKKVPWRDTRGTVGKRKKAPPEATRSIGIDEQQFRWRASEVDHEHVGSWDWKLSPKESADLLHLLSEVSACTWREIKDMKFNSKKRTRALHHFQPVESICEEARKRLEQIGRGDQEEVFRLRHGNLIRVWGVVEGPVFSILWYDRDHAICPPG